MQNLAFLLVLCFLAFSRIEGGAYNCSRSSQKCPDGINCNILKGTCQCPSTLEGADCSIVVAHKGDPECQLMCQNGGVCLKNGQGDRSCGCTVEYYGTLCEQKRYQITCLSNEILFNVNPLGTFTGSAYIYEKYSHQECRSVPVPSPSDANDGIPDEWEGHVLRVKHKSNQCGRVFPVVSKSTKNFLYKRTIVISYVEDVMTTFDDFYSGTCEVASTVIVSSGVKVMEEKTTTTVKPSGAEFLRGSIFILIICLLTAVE